MAYLKRLNRLQTDVLYPGQVLKVAHARDLTLNRDVDEEGKSPVMAHKSAGESVVRLVRNEEGEIANVEAIKASMSSEAWYASTE